MGRIIKEKNIMKNTLKIYNRPIYTYWKSHKCLKCSDEVRVNETIKIVNPDSDEFKEYARWFDGYPIGDVKIKEIIFACRRCDFRAKELTYYYIDKGTSRMERQDNECEDNIRIKYLYEDNILYAFSKKWSCKQCNTKIKLNYDVIQAQETNQPTFDSFRRKKNSEGKTQLRKLYYECENCSTKIYMDEVEEGVTVVKHRVSNKFLVMVQLIMLILIVLIYVLIKR